MSSVPSTDRREMAGAGREAEEKEEKAAPVGPAAAAEAAEAAAAAPGREVRREAGLSLPVPLPENVGGSGILVLPEARREAAAEGRGGDTPVGPPSPVVVGEERAGEEGAGIREGWGGMGGGGAGDRDGKVGGGVPPEGGDGRRGEPATGGEDKRAFSRAFISKASSRDMSVERGPFSHLYQERTALKV